MPCTWQAAIGGGDPLGEDIFLWCQALRKQVGIRASRDGGNRTLSWQVSNVWGYLASDASGKIKKKKKISQGFPGGSVVKNPPLEQETRVRSWSREMPHVAGQLSPAATAIGPVLSAPALQPAKLVRPGALPPQQEQPPQWAARERQLERSPLSPSLEKSPCGNEDPAQAI